MSESLTPPSPEKNPVRILLVDDEPAIRYVVVALLEIESYVVHTAVDGQEAWEKFSSNPTGFDLVITDSQMPRLDGLTLIQLLRSAKFSGKVIVFSSSLTSERRNQLASLGVDAVVPKTENINTLLAAIRAAV